MMKVGTTPFVVSGCVPAAVPSVIQRFSGPIVAAGPALTNCAEAPNTTALPSARRAIGGVGAEAGAGGDVCTSLTPAAVMTYIDPAAMLLAL